MDGEPTEFKEITGSIKSVGKRFKEALKQGKNVFINIKSLLLIDDVWKKIKGELNGKKNIEGKIYVYCQEKFYSQDLANLI